MLQDQDMDGTADTTTVLLRAWRHDQTTIVRVIVGRSGNTRWERNFTSVPDALLYVEQVLGFWEDDPVEPAGDVPRS